MASIARFPSENPSPVLRISGDGTVLYANEAAKPLLSARGSAAGQVAPAKWRELAADALASGTEQNIDIEHDDRIFSFSIVPVAEVNYVNLYGMDITDRKRAEDRLHHAAKMEAIGRLAGGVAHEFNNCLAAITGYSDLLLLELPDEASCREEIKEIAQAANRAAQLTRQLLAFGRKAIIAPQVISLKSILSDITNTLERILGENIELSVRQAPHLDNIKADSGQIQQVIMNLAINARDAMPSGGRLTIETANAELDASYIEEHPEASPGRHVALAVSDTGAGMDEDTLAHVFEPFFTTKPIGEGAGLGLATVHGIVEQSGGHITVESAVGLGTTFRVYFPAVAGPQQAPREAEHPVAHPVGTETILVVEDDETVRKFLVRALELRGFTALPTGSPEEALAIAQDYPSQIHLLVTDVVMPEMSGSELAVRIAGILPEMPVLYISGYTKDAIPDRVIAEAEIELLTKPFSPDELCERARRVLDAAPAKK